MPNKKNRTKEFKIYMASLKSHKDLTNKDIALEFGVKESDIKNMRYGSKKVDESLFDRIKDKYGEMEDDEDPQFKEYKVWAEEEMKRLKETISVQNSMLKKMLDEEK